MKQQVKSKLLMKRSCLMLLMTLVSFASYATAVSGTKTIGIDYSTLAACITDLNANGIAGNVIINVPGGWTETAPSGGYVLGSSTLNASMSATSTLTIQKNGGTTANPLLTAFVGTTTATDGIFIIQGTDYVTINNIDLQESTANTTPTTQMEWGYAMVKLQNTAPFDGCQYVTIQNCVVTLNQANTASVGIYSGNHIATSTTALTLTAAGDALSNCSFYGNMISNVNRCISLIGFTAAAIPYTLYDQNNTIGGTATSAGNSLTNFGGSATAGYGIYVAGNNNTVIQNNSIVSATTPGSAGIYGIFQGQASNSALTIANNTFQLTLGATGNMYGIANGTAAVNTGLSGLTASLIITGNTFQNYSLTAANASPQYVALYNQAGTTSGWDLGVLRFSNNKVQNISINSTGNLYCYYSNYCNSNTDLRLNDNKFNGIRHSTTANYTYVLYHNSSLPTNGTDSLVRNKITNCSGSYLYAFYNTTSNNVRNRVIMYDTLMYDTCGLGTTFTTLYGLYNSGGNVLTVANNYISNLYAPPASSTTIYGCYTTSGVTHNIYNNTVTNLSASAGMYGIYTSGSTTSSTVYNNSISNVTWPSGASTGSGFPLYAAGSGTVTHYNNVARNINSLSNNPIYGIYNGGGAIMSFYNDTVYNLSNASTSTSSHVYGYYQSTGTNVSVYNNRFSNLNNTGTAGNAYGAYFSSATTINLYQNTFDTIKVSNSSSTGLAYGIYQSSGSIFNCYKNKISYVTANGVSGGVNGIYAGAGNIKIHNNLIGNLQTPASTNTSGGYLVGIYLGPSNSSGYSVSYNTVVLNSATAYPYSSSTLYWGYAGSGYPLTLKNNIFINNTNPSGGGTAAAMRWNVNTTTYYNTLGSNNNLFYAGTPSATNVILYATSVYSTMPTFQSLVSPADANSVTENTTFQSLTGLTSGFLRPSLSVPTQIESNGSNITGITDDHFGTTRAGNAGYTGTGVSPDLGAIEDNYTPNDVNAPVIGLSPLPFSCGTGNRTFSTAITDVTGVPTTGTLMPRVYFKRGLAGTWKSMPGALASGTTVSGNWNFTIPADSLVIGGPSVGDTVYYFVIAQDVVSTPNIGSTPFGAAATDVNTITTYPTGSYYLVAASLSGTYTVGVGGSYTTLTAAATAYNNSCISGPVVFSLTDTAYPGETLPITFNVNAYASATNNLTIKPAVGVNAKISGSSANSAIIKLNGADYITIDGSNTAGGTTKNLTLKNTSTASGSTAFWNAALGGAGNGADFNTIKNTIVIGGTNASGTTSSAIATSASSGTTNNGDDIKNFTVQNCKVSQAYWGILLNGSVAFPQTNTLITQDSIGGSSATDYMGLFAIYFNQQNNITISSNTIYNHKLSPALSIAGIEVGPNNTNAKIIRNSIVGIWNENSGGYGAYGIDFSNSGNSNILIANNMISDIHTINISLTSTLAPTGIRLSTANPGVKIYHNTINMIGSSPVGTAANVSSCITYINSFPGLEIVNNILHNDITNPTAGSVNYGIFQATSGLTYGVIDYNDYSGTNTTNTTFKVGCNGTGTPLPTKANWISNTGQDAHSIDTLPTFVSATDFHLQPVVGNGPFLFGTPLSAVTNDFDGTTRSTVSPVIGAHELYIPPTVLVNPSTLSFMPQTVSTYAPSQSFTLTGSYLAPGGVLTVTATPSANFQVSPDGTTWSSSYTITYTGLTTSNVVYVRFYPTATGTFTGNVAITGGGLPSAINVSLNGTGASLCTGTPTAGTAAITPGIGDPSTPFTLTLTGTTIAGGLSYQWQSSPTGASGTFANIPGATMTTYNFTGISGNTTYQAVVTCPSYAAATSNTVVATFSLTATYTGNIGRYVVPAGTYALRIIAKGAQGGNSNANPAAGGKGAIMQGDICVTPGQVLKYIVGQQPSLVTYCGGGGGGSFVWDSATATPLIIAGGGGGAGYVISSYGIGAGNGMDASTGTSGTIQGGISGAGGAGVGGYGATVPPAAVSYYSSGGAGWFSNGAATGYTSCASTSTGGFMPLAGGAGGTWGGSAATFCSPGGFGGGGGAQASCTTGIGGGGGGGYSGGAAGIYSPSSYSYGGGGGGSLNTGLNQVNSVANTGNGTIIFTVPVTATAVASTPSITFPVTTTGTASAAQTYTVSVNGLVTGGTFTLAPTAGFEVSFNGSTWCSSSSPCTYSYPSNCVSIPVYVRSLPTAVGAYTGTATLTGGNLATPLVVNLNGNGANVCTGTPTPGVAAITPVSGNSATPFTLSLSGTTVAGGLSYQWQSSASGTAGSFTNIAGATNSTYNFTGISANTWYQAVVTCPSYAAATTNTVAASYVITMGYTGTIGTYVVPAGVYGLKITAKGAQGGNAIYYTGSGGLGAIMSGEFCVTPGQVLKYIAGQQPAAAVYAGGGGGGSFVWDSATGTPLIIGGGGGGGAYVSPSTGSAAGMNASIGTSGTQGAGSFAAGGAGTGGNGATNPTAAPATYYASGGAGWFTNGNNTNHTGCTTTATGGVRPLAGGTGGAAGLSSAAYSSPGGFGGGGGAEACTSTGAGGGGGYSGGAAGVYASTGYCYGGGGGGSLNTGINQVNSIGNMGNGVVIFTSSATANGVASTSSLTFPVTTTGASSPAQTYSVSISNLVAGGTLSVSATPGFDVSFDGSTWCGSSAPCTSGYTSYCTTIPLYVRSSPTSVGVYTGTATLSGGNLGVPVVVDLNGQGASACTGTPVAGNSISTLISAGITTSFTVSDTGTSVVGGLTYQWQSSLDNVTWTNISGATNYFATISGISVPTYFRSIVTCAASSGSSNSTPVLVNFLPTPWCSTASGSWSNTSLGNAAYGVNTFNITGYAGSTLSDAGVYSASGSTTSYLDRTTTVPPVDMQQGGVYPAVITKSTTSTSAYHQVWIDYNNDGVFSTSEEVCPVSGWNVSANPYNVNITVSNFAPLGLHLMRIRAIWEVSGTGIGAAPAHMDPCQKQYNCVNPAYYSGTATDYYVNILPLPVCSGTPAPGSITASVASGCAPLTSNMSVSGVTTGASGLAFQWQSSPDNATWTNITGATTMAYSPVANATTYYRVATTCTASAATAYAPGVLLTVSVTPTPITGTFSICPSSTTTLGNTELGGTWTSVFPSIAAIDPATGLVTAGASGLSLINYTLSNGCRASATMAVMAPLASPAITASASVMCNNSISALSVPAATPLNVVNGWEGGVPTIPGTLVGGWNTTAAAATHITANTSGANPVASPFAGSNMAVYHSRTVTAQAALISPSVNLSAVVSPTIKFWVFRDGLNYNSCAYANEGWHVLINSTGSTAGSTEIGFVPRCLSCASPTGNVTGNALPSSSGWYQYTINIPPSQTGVKYILFNGVSQSGDDCYLDSVSITGAAPAPPTWSTTTDLFKDVAATIPYVSGDSATAVYYHPTTITATTPVTYTATISNGTCATTATTIVTVNPQPDPITGTPGACEGLTTTLSSTSAGGTWQSSSPANATVDAGGVVTAVVYGTTKVSYTYPTTGCRVTQDVVINPVPAAITGTATVCAGSSTSLSTTSTGGSWTSGTTAVGTVSASGTATGIVAGYTNITYSYPTGCIAVRQLTVNPLPAIVITPSVAPTICLGDNASIDVFSPLMEFTLLNQNFNGTPGLGIWTINSSGSVDGVNEFKLSNPSTSAAGVTGDGSAFVEAAPFYGTGGTVTSFLNSPSFSTVGFGSAQLTFNEDLFSVATSDANVDVDYSIDGGSTWTTLSSQIGVSLNDLTAAWSATIPDVSIALPSGALNKPDVRLRWHYVSNYGGWWNIDNIAVKAALPAATFTWTGVGGATGLSCTGCDTVTITPGVSGANVYNVTANSTCSSNANVTVNVNPLPGAIAGATATLCVGNTISLSNPDAGGSWSSSNPSIASVDPSTGALTGVAMGTTVISYALPTTCARAVVVTVNAAPSAIVGTTHVCEAGFTTALTHAVSSGTWASSNTTFASVDVASGVVTGNVAGSVNITYTLPSGCYTSSAFAVDPTPAAFTGSLAVCELATTTLNSTSTGGTWVSTNTTTATIDPVSGVVNGLAPGNTNIIYTLLTGCQRTEIATVNVIPSISGANEVCENATTVETAASGGVWAITGSTIATVDVAGTVTGVSMGTTVLSYTMSATGCIGTKTMTVNQIPGAFTGAMSVCEGATISLGNPTPGGTWSSVSAAASVDAAGVVTGAAAGSASIIYTLPTTCARTATVSVLPVPAPIAGASAVCVGNSISYISSPLGGTWSSSSSNASVNTAGNVTGVLGGTSLISYTGTNGCVAAKPVTVNIVPPAIGGVPAVCENATTTLTNGLAGGTWSSSAPAYGTVDALTGAVGGVAAGTTAITYTLDGCSASVNVVINALPGITTGTTNVCEGLTTTLANPTTGGTWTTTSSSATVGLMTGIVNGIAAAVVNISYTLPTGCSNITPVTVKALPANISGPTQVCQGATITLSDLTPLGTWFSDNTASAGVDASGNVTGALPGSANIVYTAPNGCEKSMNVVVNPLPTISGPGSVCEGAIVGLSGAATGGAWSTSASGPASVDAVTGNVTGVVAGTATITYSLLTGCNTTANVTVKALPAAITGIAAVCPGTSVSLSSTTSGGTWSDDGSGFATINTSGVVTGAIAGATAITYTGANGCARNASVLVHPAPATFSVTGGGPYCAGTGGSAIGLSSSDASVLYQLYLGSTPVGTATAGIGGSLSFGTFTSVGTYTVHASDALTGCAQNMMGSALVSITPTVVPTVAVAAGGSTTVCAGTAVTFSATPVSGGSTPSYTWSVNGITMVSGSTSGSYSYIPVNGDVVKVALTSSAACAMPSVVNDTLTMTVNPLEMPAATIALPIGVTSVCEGSPVTLTVTTSVFGGATPAYTWYKGGISTGVTGTTYTYTPASGDLVYCEMVSSFACVVTPTVNSNTLTMITSPVFVPSVSISVAPGTVITAGTSVSFTAITSGAGPAPTYQWFKNSVAIAGETNSSFTTGILADNDSVSCKVTGTEPCGYESFNSVIMKVKPNTGLANTAGATDIILVPNPNKGEFVIKGSLPARDQEEVKFEVVNILGQVVYSGSATVKGGSISESIHLDKKLANGMYMLSLYTNSETHVFHFIVEQ